VKNSDGTYTVIIEGVTITLPRGSGESHTPRYIRYGTDTEYLEIVPETAEILHVQNGETKHTFNAESEESKDRGETDEERAERDQVVIDLQTGWTNANKLPRSAAAAGRRLRLNVKGRRTKRNGRNRKHRKLRKLTTRRR